jgi:hypothetical protein
MKVYHRKYAWLALGISVTVLLVFKLLYPYPSLVYDSYFYVQAAVFDWPVNAWPIGYSRFLRLFGLFSHSPLFFVCVQYLLLELSCLFFFFTWRFFFRPGKIVMAVMFALLFLNPLLLITCNYLQSDALFISLSILWVSQLCWIICRPRPYMIVTHAILLALAFTVRYNALYYPLIGALAFLISRQPLRLKLAGIGLPLILIASFVAYTAAQVGAITGEKQFSPMGGWKLANNAVYVYAHITPVKKERVPARLWPLDSVIRKYFLKPCEDDPSGLDKMDFAYGGYYTFVPCSPLVLYMRKVYGVEEDHINTKGWMAVGSVYQEYGTWFMRQYPGAFVQHFVAPNLFRYLKPVPEIFEEKGSFHLDERFGGGVVEQWLGLHTLSVSQSRINLWLSVLRPFPALFSIVHLLFVLGMTGFTLSGGFRNVKKPFSVCLLMVAVLWLVDLVFSLSSSGIVLRYEIFMIIVESSFGLYFLEYAYKHLDRPRPVK